MELRKQQIERFRESLWDYYARNGRGDLPWRRPEAGGSYDPYAIMVSELMLQQTQVPRVTTKYHEFLSRFPTIRMLAAAELGAVLRVWQGLGYNRRAKFLWQSAQIVDKLNYFPTSVDELIALPGIGPNTAGAILAYAFNQPVLFIETNIRTVYIHHFLANQTDITDSEIIELLRQTVPWTAGNEWSGPLASEAPDASESPREFYWALMDYGSHLKTTRGNASRASKQYTKQSKFHGSRRQIRGQVIRLLGEKPYRLSELNHIVQDDRLADVLAELTTEQLIQKHGSSYGL